MIIQNLQLQKPPGKSKSKDHLSVLERRMNLWELEKIIYLLKGAETVPKT